MEPVSLVKKPEKVSKIRKHPDKGFSMLATVPTEKKKKGDHGWPSSPFIPLDMELFNGRSHVLCPGVDMKSSENSP